MTFAWLRRLLPVSMLVLALILGLSLQVAAQEPTKPAPTADEKTKVEKAEKEGVVRTVEEVTVTGSLIPRKDLESLSPVAVVDVEEVTYQGTGRLEDLVQQLPQVFAAQNSTIANGASGTATVQLRNLGSDRTLVLLNGRRMASGDAFATAGDLNFIPAALVKRVDILTGGASSVYGADAMAGVVNFILDTEFKGFRGEVQYNAFQHNNNNQIAQDMNTASGFEAPSGSQWNNGGYNFNLAVGGTFDGSKGHASAFIDYRDIAAIWKESRDYTNCSPGRGANGPECSGSSTWQYGRFIADNGSWVLDPRTGNTDTFRKRKGSDVFNYGPYNFMQRNDRKWSGGGFARYTLSDKIEPYAEVMFMDDYSDAQIAPSGDFANTSTIHCDNPMLSADQRDKICTQNGYGLNDVANLIIMRRNVEGGNRVDQLSHTNWRLVGGIRGDLSPAWSYDIFAMKARVRAPSVYRNDLDASRIADALDVVGTQGDPSTWQCRSGNAGCVPWNIFTIGGVTREATDYIATTYMYDSGTSTKMLSANLRGDLEKSGVKFPTATEGVQLAFGGEVREESLFITPDETRRQGLGAGSGGPTLPIDGKYLTKEGFLEARVPFVQDVIGAHDLSLELGYRFANYKAEGQASKNNNSYKALLSWEPIDGLRLRGGFNRAVRAPNVQELFAAQGIGLGGTVDICANNVDTGVPSATFEQCARTGVTAAQYGNILNNPADQYNSMGGGNPQLDVETADTITGGIVWTPKFITGLSVTLDYFNIKIAGAIQSLNPDDTVQACANSGSPTLCSLVHRDRFGTLWLTNDGYTIATQQNVGDLKASGMDVSVVYPLNLGDYGFISFSLLGSTMFEQRLTTPLTDYDCAGYFGNQCGVPTPAWRHRVRATWNTKFKATFSVGWRYIHKVLNDDASDEPDLGDPSLIEAWKTNDAYQISAYNYIDLAASYRFKDKVRLTVGCNNVLDKEPNMGPSLSGNDYGPGWYGTYDPLGRGFYANLQFEF